MLPKKLQLEAESLGQGNVITIHPGAELRFRNLNHPGQTLLEWERFAGDDPSRKAGWNPLGRLLKRASCGTIIPEENGEITQGLCLKRSQHFGKIGHSVQDGNNDCNGRHDD